MTKEPNLSEVAVQALLIERRMSDRNVTLILTDLPQKNETFWRWDSAKRIHHRIGDEVGGTWRGSSTELCVTTADLHKYDSQSAFVNLEERPEAPILVYLRHKGMSGKDVLLTAPGGTQSVWAWNGVKNAHRMEAGLNTEGRELAEVVMTTEEMTLYD